jgi:putative ABC transport system ATP-binding protein
MLKLENIAKSFIQNDTRIDILSALSMEIRHGEKVAIVGPSGSGKSTLLSIMSGMDKPDSGSVFLDDENIVQLSEEKLCRIRNKKIGIIFQAFELIPSLTALENVMLPLDISGKSSEQQAFELLKELGLENRVTHLPKELSGGEQQRVAIGRALINDPDFIFADEPTGNLDTQTGAKVLDILFNMIDKHRKTLIIITHDNNLANRMDKVYNLKNGQIFELKNV